MVEDYLSDSQSGVDNEQGNNILSAEDYELYVEAGMAASAIHYLNEAITDVSEAEKLHHLSEALGFIYAMSFNSDGRFTPEESHNALTALGWSTTDSSLNGIYGTIFVYLLLYMTT